MAMEPYKTRKAPVHNGGNQAHLAGRARQAARKGWKLGIGATVGADGAHFRVWAPNASRAELILDTGRAIDMRREINGYFSVDAEAGAGTRYRYRLDGGQELPDPASRFQPEGPQGPSQVIDPDAYAWKDAAWKGIGIKGQVFYELHIGAFTPEGTLDAAALKLPLLKDIGVTAVELMPVDQTPGRWNWGYDHVNLFAPNFLYGDPEAFKRFVEEAHRLQLGVILDVVYNHFGPKDNYLGVFSADYFAKQDTEWGLAINFDGPGSRETREFFIQNACYWVSEFHLDGLRLDATQNISDKSPVHILAEISRRTREAAAPRRILLVAENEPQDVKLITPYEEGGYGLDALWTDDFHHSARVALTGLREAYLVDYKGDPQELISCVKRSFLFQGQFYGWQKKTRGTVVSGEPAERFVWYLQNHDQISNHLDGRRLNAWTQPGKYRALTALLLLSPQTPLLFMGQEFGATTPFSFFADIGRDLADSVFTGRKKFIAQFPSYAGTEAQALIPDPGREETFLNAKLNWKERGERREMVALHKDLLQLRSEDEVISVQARENIDGAVLGPSSFAVRYIGDGEDRLLLVNLGESHVIHPIPEPLLAPPAGAVWEPVWSSEDSRYGGGGETAELRGDAWHLPQESAVLFASVPDRL